jgi:hypothetical protein
MAKASPLPEADVAAIEAFCDKRTPPEYLDQMRIEVEVRGRSVTIVERRAPWLVAVDPEWTRSAVAQLRFDPPRGEWTLYSADRNSRWHEYDFIGPSTDVNVLLAEIDDDPTSIFWG